MIALDTNAVVRLLTEDDIAQRDRVIALVARNDVLLSLTVLVEVSWVLKRRYKKSRSEVAIGLEKACGLKTARVEQPDIVRRAIDCHGQGVDFADAIHLIGAEYLGARSFATFDRMLCKRAASVTTLPITVP